MTISSVSTFLSKCQQSSSESYAQFKKLLQQLKDPQSQERACEFLFELKSRCKGRDQSAYNFQFLQQDILDANDETLTLDLLQFPSTFLPEAWSFTFYEGLIRYPFNEYKNKSLIELGCGIGWITIALALRYESRLLYGLDINPKAITCAQLNVFLNAFDEEGNFKRFKQGQTLLDRVQFHESNLFSHFADQQLSVDRIIGCIPQVLNPEPEKMNSLIAETSSDEYLHSLSNYFAKQGYIEDQFGLGLIASAVEQSIPLLEPNGKLILNLGGRPGRSVLERLMQRRGFEVRRVWQTQVEQAADTEIGTLVDIEKSTGHRFEFYMSANSDTPIDARTALSYAQSGGKIYHSVDVYEAQMLFPDQVKTIFKSVDEIQSKELRSAIDLTYDDHQTAEERYSFLAFLAQHIQNTENFPYGSTSGLRYFKEQLAEYFRYYYFLNIDETQMLINPGRKELINSLLISYKPSLTLVAKSLHSLVSQELDSEDCQVLQVPSRVELLIKLAYRLQPELIVTRLDVHEVESSQMVDQLILCAKQCNALIVIDLTDHIDLSSEPKINGVYRHLAKKKMPENLILTAALMNNRVYQNYSLNIVLSSNSQIIHDLTDAAELTYSRTSTLKQFYYAHLLEQLLYFQRTRSTEDLITDSSNEDDCVSLPLSARAQKAFQHPAIQGNLLQFDSNTVRLDYGENELPAPFELKKFLFESYLLRDCTNEDHDPGKEVLQLLKQRFNYPQSVNTQRVYSNGVAPVFSALLNICLRKGQKLIIPTGSYGYFDAAAEFKGLSILRIETREENHFKLTADDLQSTLTQNPGCFVFLNAPVVNPTGAIYSATELNSILSVCAEHQATVIMDSIFTGLEFQNHSPWDLYQTILEDFTDTAAHLILMGGLSKEYAAGGLRFGYACSTSHALMDELQAEISHTPHSTLQYAVKKLLQNQLEADPSLTAHLHRQREVLKDRASQMCHLLSAKGWKPLVPEGGLFMVAKPQKLIGDSSWDAVAAGDHVTAQLFEQKNLVINNSTWTGLPGYCRFVLSGSETDFREALKRLNEFELTE